MHLEPSQSEPDRQGEERKMYACSPTAPVRATTLPDANTDMPSLQDDGYRLTYGGLDYLALHTHLKRADLYSVGNQIGVGKESDIFVVADATGTQHVLKIHRLGRISFRTVKANRDYLRNRASGSWMYMSRLAALKEFTFMKALRENGFPVPEPRAQSRHTIVMSLVDAFPLRQIVHVPDPAALYAELIDMILRLASFGLIHGDFNEFNILIKEEQPTDEPESDTAQPTLTPILIDFPQMLSVDHVNAEMYFDRDVNCIKRFFERRFHFTSNEPGPFYSDARKGLGGNGSKRLDVEVEATGFSKKMAKELETYMKDVGVDGDGGSLVEGERSARRDDDHVDDEDEEEDEEEEEEEEDDDDERSEGTAKGETEMEGANGEKPHDRPQQPDKARAAADVTDNATKAVQSAEKQDVPALSQLSIDDKT